MEIQFKSEDETRTYKVTEEVFDNILIFAKKTIRVMRESMSDMD